MTEEYVDVFSEKWTKRWKIFAYIRIGIRLVFCTILAIGLIILTVGLTPYIKGEVEWESMPFTLSQLEALGSLLLICYMVRKSVKVL